MFRRASCRLPSLRNFSAEAAAEKKIKVPSAIQRGPTDLLKALSGTVGVDPTAPHFSFIDDPAMIPSTATNKRVYYMAKEMGKKAARQLAEEWPTLFAFDRDQPRLPAFRPTKPTDPLQVEPTEAALLSMIHDREVQDACMLYERMRSENVEVSVDVQMELFRLVVYYNGKNIPFNETIEWHGLRTFGEYSRSAWAAGGIADLLFETLPQTPETRSMMIAGLCKYSSSDGNKRAKQLYKEMIAAKEVPYCEAFNGIIAVSAVKDMPKILTLMKDLNVRPNNATFTAILASAGRIESPAERIAAFESVFGEMRHCGVEISMEHLKTLMENIVHRDDGNVKTPSPDQEQAHLKTAATWLSYALDLLESKSVVAGTVNDSHFFTKAMRIASKAANLELAERLVRLYESSSNEIKLAAFTDEDYFYHKYLMLYCCLTPSIEEIETKYKSLVPRLVGVNRLLTLVLLDRLKNSPHWPLLLRVVEDCIVTRWIMDTTGSRPLFDRLVEINFEMLNATEKQQFSVLIQRIVDITIEFSRFTKEFNKRMQVKLSPARISELALLLNRIGNVDRAFEMLQLVLDPEASTGEEATVMSTGFTRPFAMRELFDSAVASGDAVRASTCLEIISATTPRNQLEVLAKKIHEKCRLTSNQKRLIDGFVRLRPQ